MLPLNRKNEDNALGYRERDGTAKKSKLILGLYHKEEYPLHLRILMFVISLRAKVTKVQRIIEPRHHYIIRDYIMLNTKMRANAESEPERDTFKLNNI